MATPTPFTVSVSDSAIDRLKQKLALSTFPDELEGSGWEYGSPLADVKRLAAYWQNDFDWKAQEAKLNKLPQFRLKVPVKGYDDVDMHFVHQKSNVKGAIPLIFVHGWPGSFIEVTKILHLLTQAGSNQPAFTVVAPSLPNFGFSSLVTKKGFEARHCAEACHNLMQALGYTSYVTQGGDWGMWTTRVMGYLYPQSVKASHINMVRASAPKLTQNPLLWLQYKTTPSTEREKQDVARTTWFEEQGSGYKGIQASKPQTLGYGLTDSPVGLLAWIYEKLHDWTDSYPWTDDEILTWVSIYYFSTAGPTASTRIYYETEHGKFGTRARSQSYIGGPKLGLAYFPRDIGIVPKTWGRTLGPVVFERDHKDGGHFAAWEKPEAIVLDLRKMFGKGGGAYGVVEGKKGYDSESAEL